MREHEKLPVIVIKLRMNVYSDTKCRLVPIKLWVVRLPRLRLSAVMVGSIPTTAMWLLQLHVMGKLNRLYSWTKMVSIRDY